MDNDSFGSCLRSRRGLGDQMAGLCIDLTSRFSSILATRATGENQGRNCPIKRAMQELDIMGE
jgi:hypothetical protein